jgi:hypothetical protein
MTEEYWMTTVRSDSVRRARQINSALAEALPRHLLFDNLHDAERWMHKQARQFWTKTEGTISKQNGMTTVFVRAVDDRGSMLFGLVQKIKKFGQ